MRVIYLVLPDYGLIAVKLRCDVHRQVVPISFALIDFRARKISLVVLAKVEVNGKFQSPN